MFSPTFPLYFLLNPIHFYLKVR